MDETWQGPPSSESFGHALRENLSKRICAKIQPGRISRHKKLRARNFYEVIVNEGEAQINYRFTEIDSE